MTLHFDHVVILVDNLVQAAEDYEALGFTVVPGGRHDNNLTHNALIAFADGTYLELLAFIDGPGALERVRPAEASFLHRVKVRGRAGEGLVDYALRSDALPQDLKRARTQGVEIEGPSMGGRERPDGEAMRWQFAIPHSLTLPFLLTDLTPRSLRVPGGQVARHPNGATAVLQLTVAVRDLAGTEAAYGALLGREPAETRAGPQETDFLLGGATLRLVTGQPEVDRPLSLTLGTNKSASAGQLNVDKTHGVPIEMLVVSG